MPRNHPPTTIISKIFLAFAPATKGADPSDLSHFFQKYPRLVNSSFRFMKSLPKKLNSAYYIASILGAFSSFFSKQNFQRFQTVQHLKIKKNVQYPTYFFAPLSTNAVVSLFDSKTKIVHIKHYGSTQCLIPGMLCTKPITTPPYNSRSSHFTFFGLSSQYFKLQERNMHHLPNVWI